MAWYGLQERPPREPEILSEVGVPQRGLVANLFAHLGPKGGQSRCFWSTFGTIYGAFGDSGDIVKIELSRERELNPEGWRESEIN